MLNSSGRNNDLTGNQSAGIGLIRLKPDHSCEHPDGTMLDPVDG
jgi:hypothetical protein